MNIHENSISVCELFCLFFLSFSSNENRISVFIEYQQHTTTSINRVKQTMTNPNDHSSVVAQWQYNLMHALHHTFPFTMIK